MFEIVLCEVWLLRKFVSGLGSACLVSRVFQLIVSQVTTVERTFRYFGKLHLNWFFPVSISERVFKRTEVFQVVNGENVKCQVETRILSGIIVASSPKDKVQRLGKHVLNYGIMSNVMLEDMFLVRLDEL